MCPQSVQKIPKSKEHPPSIFFWRKVTPPTYARYPYIYRPSAILIFTVTSKMWRLQAKHVHYCVIGFNQQTQKQFLRCFELFTRLSYLVFVCNITFCPILWMADLTDISSSPVGCRTKNTPMNLPKQIKHELADSTGLQARDWRQAKHRTSQQNHFSVFCSEASTELYTAAQIVQLKFSRDRRWRTRGSRGQHELGWSLSHGILVEAN